MRGGNFFKLTINDVPICGKTVLLRADYNVPLTADGKIDDDFRIRSSLPTIKKLLDDKCKIVIISHLGRPDGKVDPVFSIEPAAQRLAELLGEPVRFVSDCVGHRVKMAIKRAPKVSVTVLENLRFYPGEEANDPLFAEQLTKSSGAQYFVQDGFGVVHRAHASTSAITQYLPSVAGLLLEREYMTITGAMMHPSRPLLAVVGGAKISDKISLIEQLIDVADKIIIGGAMANTFFAARKIQIGKSKVEAGQESEVAKIYSKVEEKVGVKKVDDFLVLPSDVAVGKSPDASATRQEVDVHCVLPDDYILDIGGETSMRMTLSVEASKTVIWNGTLGMAEYRSFAVGSEVLARDLADHPEITSIIGGGDTADFVIHWDSHKGKSFSHVSTGGGASLELMAGDKLPGIESLLDS